MSLPLKGLAEAIRLTPGGFEIVVRLTPSGGADRLDGIGGDAAGRVFLKARVRAAPENGAANAALEVLLAKACGAPKCAVRVIKGHKARLKFLQIDAADVPATLALLEIAS